MKNRIAQVERIKELVDAYNDNDNANTSHTDKIIKCLCTVCKSSLASYLQHSYEMVQSHTRSFMLYNHNSIGILNTKTTLNKNEIKKEINALSMKFNDLERNYRNLDNKINRFKTLESIIENGINDELIVENEQERKDEQKNDEQIEALTVAYKTNHEIHNLYNLLYCQNSIYNNHCFINKQQLCLKENNIDWGILTLIIIAYRRQYHLLQLYNDKQPEYISEIITKDSIQYHVRIRLIPLHHKALVAISYHYMNNSNKIPDAQDILPLGNTDTNANQKIIGLIALRYFLHYTINKDSNDSDNINNGNTIQYQQIMYKHIYNKDVTCSINETVIINEILDIVKTF